MTRFVLDLGRSLNKKCVHHAEAISRSMDAPLRPGERAGLWLHLRVCRACRRYRQQLLRLRAILEGGGARDDSAETMPPETRARLADRLRERGS